MRDGHFRATRRRPAALVFLVVAIAIMATVDPLSADAQHGQARSNPLPAQPIGNQSATHGQGKYTPYPVKDPTAAERAEIAAWAYRTLMDRWVQRTMALQAPGGGPPDLDALGSPELAERLGQWSLRVQEAQDNTAKSLAGRYQALSDHLARMSSLENGRFLRGAFERSGFFNERPIELKPPRSFSEIARFFRPIDERGIDRVVPELVEFERPLNPLGVNVTSTARVEIARRVCETILAAAVERSLALPRADDARPNEAAVFDAPLAERLANWSEMWRQTQDDAATDAFSRSAAVRNSSVRLAMAGTRLARPDALPATVNSHVERMSALETGRFRDDAIKRAARPAAEPLDMTRLREFVAVATFFRIEAQSQRPESSKSTGTDVTFSNRAAAARQFYLAILDGAARQYMAIPGARGEPPNASSVFDSRLAERLGSWSIRWARVEAGAGGTPETQVAAVRSHLERMASLEAGRALHDALTRTGEPHAPRTPAEFARTARFFRLEARWELELIRSR